MAAVPSDDLSARVAAADRDRWLASLFAPAAVRGDLHALLAFSAEIASQLFQYLGEGFPSSRLLTKPAPLCGNLPACSCIGCRATATSRPTPWPARPCSYRVLCLRPTRRSTHLRACSHNPRGRASQ